MSTSGPVRATTQGVAADHARIAARRKRALVATALRTRSWHAREILAEAAWPGHTPAELESWARLHGPDHDPPPGSDPLLVADLARVVAVQLGSEQDRRTALTLLEQVARTPAWGQATRDRVEMLAQLRVLSGDPGGAVELAADQRVRDEVAASVRADALNPALVPGGDAGAWAAAFTTALQGPRPLAPFLPPAPGQVPSLDTLRVEPRPPVPTRGRVTVIMSCYRPGPSLLTAVSSVLGQTWSDLELFVVDDASGPDDAGWATLLDEVEASDPRVRVVRKAVNGGTYRARNTVLRQATGDYAIVVDSDDWWHPQTLEVCAAPLRRSSLMATRAEGVRVREDLVLTRPGYKPRFASAATVLFRLRPVVSRIGFFDPTRKGADTEFARRLEAAFGPVVQDVPHTTTLLRAGAETLSAEEFSNGWRHPARHQYKSLYTPWHERVARGEDDPYLDPELPRRFPEPLRWSRETHPLLDGRRHVDLCLAGDWRRDGGPQRSMMEEIRAAREAGLRVGVMHLEALRFMTPQDGPVSEPFLDLVRSGEVDWVQPDDDLDIDVLMVRYPPILQYPPTLPRSVRARHVLVMANQGPVEPDGSDQRYVVSDVSARAEELFGRPVTWVPQSPTIRRVLREQDPTVRLTDWDNPGLIDLDAWAVRSPRVPGAGGRPVVVGRHSRDTAIKFPPSWEEMLRGYRFPDGYEVRLLGAVDTVAALRERAGEDSPPVPPGWTLLPHQTEDVRPFLADLDFVLYLDNPDAHEAFGRTLLEAAASGVLTIAHPKHRPTFGDVLDYAEPGEAQAVIGRYVADPEAYAARVARTRALVAERYGHGGFVDHLRPLLGGAGPEVLVPLPSGPVEIVPAASTERLVVDVSGADAEHLPLRSAADGERADGAVVVHHGVPTHVLAAWLQRALAGTSGPTWSSTELLATAPDGVAAVLVLRDGLVQACGRGSWRGAGRDPELSALAGPEVPDGWTDLAWWAARPPGPLTLLPTADQKDSP